MIVLPAAAPAATAVDQAGTGESRRSAPADRATVGTAGYELNRPRASAHRTGRLGPRRVRPVRRQAPARHRPRVRPAPDLRGAVPVAGTVASPAITAPGDRGGSSAAASPLPRPGVEQPAPRRERFQSASPRQRVRGRLSAHSPLNAAGFPNAANSGPASTPRRVSARPRPANVPPAVIGYSVVGLVPSGVSTARSLVPYDLSSACRFGSARGRAVRAAHRGPLRGLHLRNQAFSADPGGAVGEPPPLAEVADRRRTSDMTRRHVPRRRGAGPPAGYGRGPPCLTVCGVRRSHPVSGWQRRHSHSAHAHGRVRAGRSPCLRFARHLDPQPLTAEGSRLERPG